MFKWKRLVIILIAILVFITVQVRFSAVDGPFRGVFGNILNPTIYLSTSIISGIKSIWNNYFFLVGLKKKNNHLKEEIDNLTLENILLSEKLRQANTIISKFTTQTFKTVDYNYFDNYIAKYTPASVIGMSDGYVKSIVINAGSLKGISVDDIVISFHGLVGKVKETFLNTSNVDLISNLNINVSILNSRTRTPGILRSNGKGKLFIDYYDRLDNAKVGDKIITSGLGQLYPKGILIGTIAEVNKDQSGLFQDILVQPAEDFSRMENVFVVKNFK